MSWPGFSRYQGVLFVAFVMATLVLSWNPRYPEDQVLQHIPTVLSALLLVATARRLPLSNASFTLFIAFLLLHVVGARWVYTFTPYDDWTEALFGVRLGEELGWRRNHFDRFVHFSFGLLCFYPFREVLARLARPRRGWASWFALELILAASLAYELIEWSMALIFAPETADRYLGQQGDAWDAHKDSALAALGGVIALALLVMGRRAGAALRRAP
ncbi:MAG: DUF2238 domain-containing protein [Planctomycetota bacterium]